jgi:hypothetical protein
MGDLTLPTEVHDALLRLVGTDRNHDWYSEYEKVRRAIKAAQLIAMADTIKAITDGLHDAGWTETSALAAQERGFRAQAAAIREGR